MRYKILLLSVLAIATSCMAKANGDPNEATRKNDILGGVYESGTKKPLINVVVTAYLTSKKEKVVVTDDEGNYSFDDLKPGTYKLVFEKEGFKKVTKEKLFIRPDEGFQLDVDMVEERDFDFIPAPFSF
jgi:hypothetical protein